MSRLHIKQDDLRINDILFYLCLFVTVAAVGMTLVRFFAHGVFPEGSMNLFYIGVLAIYALHKEAIRWMIEGGEVVAHRRGEYFVYFWIVLVTFLYLVNFFSGGRYPAGEETMLSDTAFLALEVGGVFLLARMAKIARICKN